MCKDVIIIGASGHAKVIANIVKLNGDNIIGFLDDNIEKGTKIIDDICVLGKIVECKNFNNDKNYYIIGIGNNEIRERISKEYDLNYYTAIHPSAIIDNTTKIGKGTAVMANAVINASTTIKDHCIINTGAIIEHDNIIENYVHISPNATLCGNVYIGEKTHIGAGVIVKNNIRVCNDCTIGVGAAVVKNIDEKGIYIGVPARRNNEKSIVCSDCN